MCEQIKTCGSCKSSDEMPPVPGCESDNDILKQGTCKKKLMPDGGTYVAGSFHYLSDNADNCQGWKSKDDPTNK